jgi:hypothetical protein
VARPYPLPRHHHNQELTVAAVGCDMDMGKFAGPDTALSPYPWNSLQPAELPGPRETYQKTAQKEK